MKRLWFVIAALGTFSFACQLSQPISDAPVTETSPAVEAVSIQIVHATMIYYEISGSSADELRVQMNQLGPLDLMNGQHYDARTDWHISWTWPGYGSNDCDLSKTTVSYDIKATVPHWQPAPGTDQKLIAQWNGYLNNLALHEQGHVDSIARNYIQVKDAIRRATCSTAEEAAQDMLDIFRQANAEYDQQTNHGETQGAIFP